MTLFDLGDIISNFCFSIFTIDFQVRLILALAGVTIVCGISKIIENNSD